MTNFDLPRREDWYWEPVKYTNRVVEPGEEWAMWDKKGNGWLHYALIAVNNPDAKLILDVRADKKIDLKLTFRELVELGNIGLGAGYFNVTEFRENYCVVQYTPGFPGLPFRGKNYCAVRNDLDEPIVVLLVQAWLIMLR